MSDFTRTPKTIAKYEEGIERLQTSLPTGYKERLKQHCAKQGLSIPAWILSCYERDLRENRVS